MRTPPVISVLIPSFNQDRYLLKTLATIVKQDYPNLEVIIADGGSTDRTSAVVRAYGSLVTKFASEPDRGQLHGIEKAIALATGDIYYWCNADDAIMPGAFEYVAAQFAADPTLDLLFSDSFAFEEEMRHLAVSARVSNMTFWDHFLFHPHLPSEGIFWRSHITQQAFPLNYGLRVYTDHSFFLPLRYQRKCRWVPRRLGAFRIQPEQMSRVHTDRRLAEVTTITDDMCRRICITADDYQRLRRRHYLSYMVRRQCYPKAFSAARYLWRRLTGDRDRHRVATMLFDDWLKPPENVVGQLGSELCGLSSGQPSLAAAPAWKAGRA